MSKVIDLPALAALLKEAASRWSRHSEEIGRLDAAIADGDMGVTVELGSKAMIEYLSGPPEEDIGKLLMKCGMQVNKASPSTFGTLLASAFMEAGKAVQGRKEIGIDDLALLGKSAVEGIQKRGKAQAGEKTMLDALIPAVEAFGKALESGSESRQAIDSAIVASKAGMEATVNMKAKYSRASYRPDGGVGVQDAGATAMYYLIEALGQSSVA